MNIQYTPKFIKLMGKLKDKRGKEETEKIIEKIENAKDFTELNNLLDIKKYDIGGYRIRYSGKPEMRIRFSLTTDPTDKKKKILDLRWVGTREDYDKISKKPMKESIERKTIILITKTQFNKLVKL